MLNFTQFVATSGYVAIFVLSVLQSCCVPTSSELTLGFAGMFAAEGKLSLPGVIVAGAAGELVGAYIAWAIGYRGGRLFVERYGRYVLMSADDLDRAERWYARHSRFGVFGGRLLTVIRNFVTVPAGVAEVPCGAFRGPHCARLADLGRGDGLIGYGIGGSWRSVMKGFSDAGYLLGVLLVIAVAVVVRHRWVAYQRSVRRGNAARLGRSAGAGRHGSAGRAVPAATAVSAPAGSLADKVAQARARAADAGPVGRRAARSRPRRDDGIEQG